MSESWEPSIDQRMFVAALAKCVSPMQPADATNAILAFLPSCRHIPEAVFADPGALATILSIEHKWSGVPSLAKFRRALELWAETHLPKAASDIDPPELDASGLSAEERCNVRVWLAARAKGASERDLLGRLAVLRAHVNRAYRWLINFDMQAADMAVRQRWYDGQPPMTAEERAAMPPVAPALQRALHPELTVAAERARDHDEQRLATQPSTVAPAVLATRDSAPPQESTPPARPLGALSPERLAAIRDANPAVQSARAVAALVAEERAQAAAEAERERELEHATATRAHHPLWTDDADLIDPPLAPLTWPDE
jgi:hypothetical protein